MSDLIAQGVKTQMCVTSPPYFGLRDYGHAGQIGLEATPAEYVAKMVDVFCLVREMLADDGVLWLNLGDSYAAKKQLLGMPWRVAFALQEAGWYLRQDIIWAKPNPMPESVKDRCTKSHEYLFLMSKSERYYFNTEAIAEPVTQSTIERLAQPSLDQQHGSDRVPGKTNGAMKAVPPSWNGSSFDKGKTGEMMKSRGHTKQFNSSQGGGGTSFVGHSGYFKADGSPICGDKRNKRSVWTVATVPYKGAHFATFPPALIEPCILAGSRVGDIVLDPFFGSGTSGQVAQQLGRRWIGCELNQDYEPLQQERVSQTGLVFA